MARAAIKHFSIAFLACFRLVAVSGVHLAVAALTPTALYRMIYSVSANDCYAPRTVVGYRCVSKSWSGNADAAGALMTTNG
jgi:hypothetical protein